MRKLIFGAATIALAASIANAQPSKNEDKGGGNGQPAAERGHDHGQGKGRADDRVGERTPQPQAERGGPPQRDQRGKPEEQRADRQERADRIENSRSQANRWSERREDKSEDRRGQSERRGKERTRDRDDRRPSTREVARERERVVFARLGRDQRSIVDGCPPGLARRNNGCTPPGLARKQWTQYRPAYFGYPAVGDGRYFYDDGYLFRLGDGDSILGFIPLLGGALGIGEIWPSFYEPAPLPPYYVEYYNLGDQPEYRYADDVIYRVDPSNSAITSIAALLTGDTFAIGQPMPDGYDVYNVPYGYRDRYYDTDDAYYRYADGYIYEVDPTTQLIAAVIELVA